MATVKTAQKRTARTGRVSVATIAMLGAAAVVYVMVPTSAQQGTATGVIAGNVTADAGDVVALRVKARDTVHKIAYTVFTQGGRYQIHNLPPSTYDVQVLEAQFDSPTRTVVVTAGTTQTADLALRSTGPAPVLTAGNQDAAAVDLVDFDTLYPPSPARDVMLRNCFTCHGLRLGWHNRGRKTEAQWRREVGKMFRDDHRIANLQPGVPMVTTERVSEEEQESIVQYLTQQFGPNSTPRDLKMDTLVRDETALAEVMYVQFDVPPPTFEGFSNTGDPGVGLHDVHVSPSQPGVIWITGNGSGSIVKIDTRTLDYMDRTTRWRIPHPDNLNVVPHGIIERNELVYWSELAGDRIGVLDPKTDEIFAYSLPTEGGGAHTLRADTRGNIWYTNYAASGRIGRLNLASREVREYEPSPGFSGYGLTTDNKDRVWAVGLNEEALLGYDPKTDMWTSYPLSSAGRRPAVDSKGQVWVAEFYGNRIAMLDPESGTLTEHELPLKYGDPYELIADSQDNIWVENTAYNSLVKFDQTTNESTYVPYPEIKAATVKFEREPDDTIWFIMGRPPTLTGFKPRGNVAAR
jgi:virginiamycin B lyase